jgi:hypothetical protein
MWAALVEGDIIAAAIAEPLKEHVLFWLDVEDLSELLE